MIAQSLNRREKKIISIKLELSFKKKILIIRLVKYALHNFTVSALV
jgi:hypothetical protein